LKLILNINTETDVPIVRYFFLDFGLRIAKVEKKHAGLFQCFATNPMGTVTSPAELKVLAKQITAMAMANDGTGQ
jgi:aspartate/methionine/tyrosine aminotransferase